eukprot:TRINITY_DN6644_c0_g1_i1.p3 TRINITY_DN6644_c0_g1~~TRINITY_DN6644_c0_g1_i1.p3  ORF type:complete len:105 (-),score=15.82 TRINITY_DN6644_c0_g1_i1:32-346(-)
MDILNFKYDVRWNVTQTFMSGKFVEGMQRKRTLHLKQHTTPPTWLNFVFVLHKQFLGEESIYQNFDEFHALRQCGTVDDYALQFVNGRMKLLEGKLLKEERAIY